MGPSVKYVRKISRKTKISNSLIRTLMCAYRGVRNVSLSENFAYILNRWSLWVCQIWNLLKRATYMWSTAILKNLENVSGNRVIIMILPTGLNWEYTTIQINTYNKTLFNICGWFKKQDFVRKVMYENFCFGNTQ